MCQDDKVVGIIGTRYTDDSKQIAYMSQGFKVPQISYGGQHTPNTLTTHTTHTQSQQHTHYTNKQQANHSLHTT